MLEIPDVGLIFLSFCYKAVGEVCENAVSSFPVFFHAEKLPSMRSLRLHSSEPHVAQLPW